MPILRKVLRLGDFGGALSRVRESEELPGYTILTRNHMIEAAAATDAVR